MSWIAAVSICLCALVGCGGDGAPAAPPPPATTPPPTPPPAPEPPETPAGLRVSATGPDFIEWSWNPVSEVSGYQAQYRLDDVFTEDDDLIDRTADETSYRRENVPAETTAYLRVRSSSGMGEDSIHGAWSTHVHGMTAAAEPTPPASTQTWRGLTVAPEERCSPYDADDYRYPQSVENDIVRELGVSTARTPARASTRPGRPISSTSWRDPRRTIPACAGLTPARAPDSRGIYSI